MLKWRWRNSWCRVIGDCVIDKHYTMKTNLFILLAFLLLAVCPKADAQKQPYAVVFYNLENLFDTIPSPGVFDREFTPGGSKVWNSSKYWKKIGNIEQVFFEIAKTVKSYPAVIGVCELENRNVLEDVVAAPKLAKANYDIVHYDSPDARGVDVALLYRPDMFKVEGSKSLRVTLPGQPDFKTRDVLMVWGLMGGERFCFFVNHWPSRLGGQAASESKRVEAAKVVRRAVDSISGVYPDMKVVIMGDLNDDPVCRSLTEGLGAKGKPSEVKAGDLFNPYVAMFKAGYGTLAYQDGWNLFDNMVVNENLLNASSGKLKLRKHGKFYGYIFDRPFLHQQSGRYKGYPLRTFVGDTFQGGYSDHFPVYLLIE